MNFVQCIHILSILVFVGQGDIYPCTYVIGNKDFKLENIIDGIDINKVKLIKNINKRKVSECLECEMYDFCESTRCLLLNYVTTGDFYKPNLLNCNMLNMKNNLLL